MDLATHVALPVPFRVNGKDWNVGPISLKEVAKIADYIAIKPLMDAKEVAKDMPEDMSAMLLKEAWATYNEERKASSTDPQVVFAKMGDMRVACEFMWLAIVKNHPEVTRDEVWETIQLTNMDEVNKTLEAAMGVAEGPNPTQAPTLAGRQS